MALKWLGFDSGFGRCMQWVGLTCGGMQRAGHVPAVDPGFEAEPSEQHNPVLFGQWCNASK